MAWLIGIYVVVGLFKGIGRLSASPAYKPVWMMMERNPLKWSLYFCFYVMCWPLIK